MRIVVLGATGRTGRLIVEQALARGHEVAALVRSPDKLAGMNHLELLRGDPRDADALTDAMSGQDAVASALGPRSANDDKLLPDCTNSIVAAMRRAGVRRVVALSSALLFPDLRGPLAAFLRWLIRGALRGAREGERILRANDLSWTAVRPVRLTNAPPTNAYRFASGQLPPNPKPIARADVAHFVLQQVEQTDPAGGILGLCQ
jgi:putative NADH-flavin reductase